MKILIIGMARHGKDTFAELLAKKLGCSFQSSSRAALEVFLFERLNTLRSWTKLPPYASLDEAYEDRVNHRRLWFEEIRDYNTPDRTRLTRDILAKHDIYVGMRNIEELRATRHLFDCVVWVDAFPRLRTRESQDSISISPADADWIVDNNFDLKALSEQADILALHLLNRSTGHPC